MLVGLYCTVLEGRRQRSEGTQHQCPFPERLQAPKPRSTYQGAALLVTVVWIQGTS